MLRFLEEKPFSIMSAHDTSVAPLIALLTDDIKCGQPGYASAIVIERWNINGVESVRLRFRDGPDESLSYKPLLVCENDTCTMAQFREYL